MASKTFLLEIVTPEKAVLSQEVESIVVPAHEGYLGVLAGHAPLLSTLKPGEITIRSGHEEFHYCTTGGFMEATPKKVTILSESAERVDQIDVKRAEEALQRAKERLAAADKTVDKERARAALARAEARLRIARKPR